MHGSPARIAGLLVAVAGLAAVGSPAAVAQDAEPCCQGEDLGPGELRPGIFDSCPDCRETRIYRSEILGRLWVRGEYVSWATKGQYFPPLVTASLPGTPPDDTGVLGRPTTWILFGDEELFAGMHPGGRLTGGFWFHPDQMAGIEASYFEVDQDEDGQYGIPPLLLARPFYNVTTGEQDSVLVRYPHIQPGSASVATSTRFGGAEALLRRVAGWGSGYRVDMVCGYRFGHLDDRLEVFESLELTVPPDPTVVPRDGFLTRWDLFRASNQFHGGEAGVIARWRGKYVALELLGKIALGASVNKVIINGRTTGTATYFDRRGDVVTNERFWRGGVLALPTNMGEYNSAKFSSMEELGANLEISLTCNLRAKLGYTFIYWPSVARVADQVDLGVNPSQYPFPPGNGTPSLPLRPAFDLKTTDFWAQGLNVGLEYQF